jgi:hypothetical protein
VLREIDAFLPYLPGMLPALPRGPAPARWTTLFAQPRRLARLSRLPQPGPGRTVGWLEASGLRGTLLLGLRTLLSSVLSAPRRAGVARRGLEGARASSTTSARAAMGERGRERRCSCPRNGSSTRTWRGRRGAELARRRGPGRRHGHGRGETALALAEAGHDVLLLEGQLVRTSEITDPMSMIRRLYRDAGTSVIQGRPPILFAEGRCVGGSSVINGGMCWRTPERVLESWSREHGLPEIDARAMERHFARAEQILHVELQREETFGRHSRLFADGARALGLELERNRRNMRDCMGLNNCALGCPTGAKQSMLVTTVPRALARGARLVTHARVRRVDFERGRAVGVRGALVDARGRRVGRFRARAKLVVLAAGARHTPGILLRSRVRSRALGRHLKTHPNAKAVGVFDHDLAPWVGAHQTHQLHRFLDDGILIACATVPPGLLASALPGLGRVSAARMRDYGRMLSAAVLVEDTGVGRVKLGLDREPVMASRSDGDVEQVHRGVALTARILFAAGARGAAAVRAPGFARVGRRDREDRHAAASAQAIGS